MLYQREGSRERGFSIYGWTGYAEEFSGLCYGEVLFRFGVCCLSHFLRRMLVKTFVKLSSGSISVNLCKSL